MHFSSAIFLVCAGGATVALAAPTPHSEAPLGARNTNPALLVRALHDSELVVRDLETDLYPRLISEVEAAWKAGKKERAEKKLAKAQEKVDKINGGSTDPSNVGRDLGDEELALRYFEDDSGLAARDFDGELYPRGLFSIVTSFFKSATKGSSAKKAAKAGGAIGESTESTTTSRDLGDEDLSLRGFEEDGGLATRNIDDELYPRIVSEVQATYRAGKNLKESTEKKLTKVQEKIDKVNGLGGSMDSTNVGRGFGDEETHSA